MRLAIKKWVSNGDNVLAGSLFGVCDADQPDTLPRSLPNGHWEPFRTIDESDFKHRKEAIAAIGKHGHYLFGAGDPISSLIEK